MWFLGVIAFLLFVSTFVQAHKMEIVKPCNKHKWFIDETGMKCSVCKRRAGK